MVLVRRSAALIPTLVVPDEQTWTLSGADPAAAGARPVFELADVERLLVPERLPDSLIDALAATAARLPPGVEVEQRTLHGFDGRSVMSALGREAAAQAAHGAEHDNGTQPHGGHEMHDANGQHEAHSPERQPDSHDAHAKHERHVRHDMHEGHHGGAMHAGHDMPAGHDMHADHDMHAGHAGHDMHGDHGDMMAIVGEPSADGLVMEPIELRFGPLATALPGGIAVDVTLDGDVVSEASVHALLSAPAVLDAEAAAPDLLAAVAWRVAVTRAFDTPTPEAGRWLDIAAIEIERAVSHLAWLRAFGRLLGWQRLVDACTEALDALAQSHRQSSALPASPSQSPLEVEALEHAREPAQAVVSLVSGSRWLRLRAGGRAVVTVDEARARRLRGPIARASGLSDDSRAVDPLYAQLGFEPVMQSGGDALARARVRADETVAALDLAVGATRAAAARTPAEEAVATGHATVEGPRGPVEARRLPDGWRFSAPGANEATALAGDMMRGLEWSAALVALASFDLSPWRVSE